MRRASLTVAVLVFAGLLLTACASSNGRASTGVEGGASCVHTGVLRADGISLPYPSCWKLSHYQEESTMTSDLAFLSNQPQHKPCITKRSGVDTSTTCGLPVKELGRGGVLVILIEGGQPGWAINLETGRYLVVDHHTARESVFKGHALHSTEEIATFIDSGVSDDYYALVAFFRSPAVAEDKQLYQNMLRSMKIN